MRLRWFALGLLVGGVLIRFVADLLDWSDEAIAAACFALIGVFVFLKVRGELARPPRDGS